MPIFAKSLKWTVKLESQLVVWKTELSFFRRL